MSTSVVLGVEEARTIACGVALDESGAPAEWRAALGERTGLRADLPDCKTVRGWAGRAEREMLRLVYTDGSIEDVAFAGDLNVALVESHFARSVYDSKGSDGEGGRIYREVTIADGVVERTTDRQTTYTDLTLTTKEAQACPANDCGGWLHPVTFTCGRCGVCSPEGGEVGVREDVANRYEPKVKGFFHLTFDEDGNARLSNRTLTRRGGSDKAGLNPESWEISARWESGAKPTWRQQAFGLIALQGNDGTTFLPVAFHREQAAQASEWGITIQGRGPNMGIREVTE